MLQILFRIGFTQGLDSSYGAIFIEFPQRSVLYYSVRAVITFYLQRNELITQVVIFVFKNVHSFIYKDDQSTLQRLQLILLATTRGDDLPEAVLFICNKETSAGMQRRWSLISSVFWNEMYEWRTRFNLIAINDLDELETILLRQSKWLF